jgi:hypothetical protein
MKPSFLLFLFLPFTSALHAQSPEPTRRFSIGVMASPDLAYRTLVNRDGSRNSDIVIDIRNKSEIPRPSFTAGLSVLYRLSARWGFESGLQYSNKGEQNKETEFIYGTLATSGKYWHEYHYFEVPLLANFAPGSRRLRFIATAGLVPQFYLGANSHSCLKYADGSKQHRNIEQNIDATPLTVAAAIGAGIDWQVSRHFSLRVQPTFRHGLVPEIVERRFKEYLWSAGLKTAVFFGR